MLEQERQPPEQSITKSKVQVFLAALLIGCLSMLFAEVFSGASQTWFLTGWGWLLTLPLYLGHVLFFLWLALKLKRTSLSQLYLFGVVFGLYESWITKVLWAGYFNEAGPAVGTIAGLGISEFPILVFFWHPIMSFIVPILVFEILTGHIFKEHANILRKSAKKTGFIALFLVLVSTFIATGNSYDLVSANLSLIGTLLLVCGLHYVAKKPHVKLFEFGRIGSVTLIIYLLLLYISTFFLLLPERIPHTPMPYISIIIFYILLVLIIRKTKRVETEFIQPDSDYYSIGDLKKFALITIVAVNIAVLVPSISFVVMTITYFMLAFVGTILFVCVVYKIVRNGYFTPAL